MSNYGNINKRWKAQQKNWEEDWVRRRMETKRW